MTISAKYIKWVEDYFKVNDAILDYLDEKYEQDCYWNTSSLTKLEIIDDYDQELIYDLSELTNLLKLEENTVKHFFSVHCCIDNMYPILVNQKHNTGWYAYKNLVYIEFFNPSEAHLERSFGTYEIAKLLEDTEHVGWSYQDLQRSSH